jgi:maltose alpha-D-glucosyltransferase/alpha-amylase
MPGTPVIRYGDEIGMGDDLELPERECARTPMQWSTEPQAGFTKAARPLKPVISEGPYGYEHVNVAKQRRDPNSLVNWTERMIRMRKEVPEIGWGDFEILDTGTPAVLGVRYDWLNNSVLALHNFSAQPLEVQFEAGAGERGTLLVNLLTEDHSRADERGRHGVVLEPYGYRWYRVGGLDYLLVRSEVDATPAKRGAKASKRGAKASKRGAKASKRGAKASKRGAKASKRPREVKSRSGRRARA